jgi:hypothetical protein
MNLSRGLASSNFETIDFSFDSNSESAYTVSMSLENEGLLLETEGKNTEPFTLAYNSDSLSLRNGDKHLVSRKLSQAPAHTVTISVAFQ